MRTPAVAADTDPGLSVLYNSGAVDGRSVSENNQTSWVGEGFDLGAGFIERTYRTCADDITAGANTQAKKGDLCWAGDNVSISFGQWSGELVRTDSGAVETAGTFRLRDDNGAQLLRKTAGGFSGDNNGEYWVLQTPDGFSYYFGQGKVSSAGQALNSAWTVPVYGNQPGEPCYAATFANASCTQVWRWNLDRVVDPRGNVTLYTYATESNRYGKNLNASSAAYIRGGHLSQIAYGLRSGSESATAPARVRFAVAERCIPTETFDCAPAKLTTANAAKWPDVPFDQICTSTTSCPDQFSPTFFTRKRLTSVVTETHNGTAYVPVDTWDFEHSFPATGDGTSRALWLASIQHTGSAGTAVALPKTQFYGINLSNRVDGIGDFAEPFHKWRVNQIVTESGGQIAVVYSDSECTPATKPASESGNTKLCYPQWFTPTGFTDPQVHWFHKYLVRQVEVQDLSNSGSADLTTRYEYLGAPAWAYQDRPGIKSKYRTWNQWRGYPRVQEIQGGADTPKQVVETTYFRGLDGDKASDASGDTSVRNVAVTDSTGESTPDHWRLASLPREVEVFAGVGGTRLSSQVTSYKVTTVGSDGGREIRSAPIVKDETRTFLDGGARFEVTRVHTYDQQGFVTSTDDLARRVAANGTVSQSERTCRRLTYARNTAKWLLDRVASEEVVSVGCSAAVSRPADIISSTRTSFDNLAVGVTPTAGNPTTVEQLVSDGVTQKWVPTTRTGYDAYGRVVSSTDARGKATTTAFTGQAATGGMAASVKVTTPDPDGTGPLTALASTTTYNTRIGQPTKVVAASGAVTEATYDALGRLVKLWRPGRAKATQTPSEEFSYAVRQSGNNAVTTSSLLPSGGRRTTVALYDGLLRDRQTQTQTETMGAAGTPVVATWITDTLYNSRGLVAAVRPYVLAEGAPVSTIQNVTVAATTNETRTSYDAAGRVLREVLSGRNDSTGGQLEELARTTYAYTGETTTVTPPAGGTVTSATVDARGRTITRLRYPAGVASNPVTYSYGYDAAGNLDRVLDEDGNTWSYTYDTLGRRLSTSDPDAGTSTATYDDAGRQLTLAQGSGASAVLRAFEYDDLGRKTGEFLGTGASRQQMFGWAYDTATNGKGLPASSTTYRNGAVLYTESVTGYDTAGRPLGTSVKFTQTPGLIPAGLAAAYTVSNTYYEDGSLRETSTPDYGDLLAESVGRTYDGLGRLESMAGWGSYLREADYLPFGQVSRLALGNTYGKVLWLDSWYDTATFRLDQFMVDAETTAGIDSTRAYSYDLLGRPTSIQDTTATEGTDTQCFARDGLGQLTDSWTPASGSCAAAPATAALGGPAPYRLQWAYDNETGNRTRQVDSTNAANVVTDTYTYPAAGSARPHAATSVSRTGGTNPGTTSHSYDDRGNMTGRGDQSLVWDAANRLSSVSSAGVVRQAQVSDANGRRLVRLTGGTVTVYLPDGTEATAAVDGTGTVDATRYYSAAGQTIAVRTGTPASTVTTLVNDQQGSPVYAYGNTTTTLTPRRQTPFGGSRGADTMPGQRRFVGATKDDAVGLLQIGVRPYDPTQGRFLAVDPIVDPGDPAQTAAAYAYAKNDPLTYTDPTGLMPAPVENAMPQPPKPNPGGGASGGSGGGSGGGGSSSSSGGGGSGILDDAWWNPPAAPATPPPPPLVIDIDIPDFGDIFGWGGNRSRKPPSVQPGKPLSSRCADCAGSLSSRVAKAAGVSPESVVGHTLDGQGLLLEMLGQKSTAASIASNGLGLVAGPIGQVALPT